MDDIDTKAEQNKRAFNQSMTYDEEEEKKRKDVNYRLRHPSIRVIFDRIKPVSRKEDFKKIFLKKLRVILGPLSLKYRPNENEPSMENAFIYLGQAQARLMLLEEVAVFIQNSICEGLYGRSPVWPDELWRLKELTIKQIATCGQLVKAILYKADNDQQEAKDLPTVKNVDWED